MSSLESVWESFLALDLDSEKRAAGKKLRQFLAINLEPDSGEQTERVAEFLELKRESDKKTLNKKLSAFLERDLCPATRDIAERMKGFVANDVFQASQVLSGQMSGDVDAEAIRKIERAVHRLLGNNLDIQYCRVFRLFVEYANRTGGCDLPLPAIPIKLEALPSVFKDFPPTAAERAEDWRASLTHWLEGDPVINSKVGLGALIVSASLNSGVVDSGALLELMKSATRELTVVGRRGYVDLELPWRGSANLERRRWFPDAISEMIFLRLSLKPEELPELKSPAKSLWPFIRAWFRDSGCQAKCIPRKFSEFINASKALNYHELPMDIGAYMTRSHISHSLRPETWHRLHGIHQQPADIDAQLAHLDSIEVNAKGDAEKFPATDTFEWAEELWQSLKSTDRDLAAQKLAGLLETDDYQTGTVERLLAQWALALCSRPASSGKRIALSTIRQYLTQVGKRVAALSGDADVASFDAAELEELYVEVIGDGESAGMRDKLRSGLREFHYFLHHHYGVPKLSEVMNLGGGSILHPVDANLISVDEYHRIRAAIRNADLELKAPGLSTITELIFVLGFRCGLRRMETLGLRIQDVHLLGRPEILVRRYDGHRLKTGNAQRKMPLYALLEEDELTLLTDWVEQRRVQEQTFSRSRALFYIPRNDASFVDQDRVMPALHGIMRRVTGDTSLRYHHLRHSFASWTFLRLSLAQHGKRCELLPDQSETERWLDQSGDLQNRLLSERHRVNLYAVARLLGHAGPDMSLEHYIHTMDLAGLATDDRRTSFCEKTLVMASGLPTSSAYRLLKISGIAGLLQRVRAGHPDRVHELLPNARPDLSDEPEEGTLLHTLERVRRYLKYRHKTVVDKKVLAGRFELSEEECSLIERQVEYLAGLRSNDNRTNSSRHRFIVKPEEDSESLEGAAIDLHTEPRTRSSQGAYQDFADRVAVLFEDAPELVWEMVDYYIHNQWKTRGGLIFRDSDDPGMAQKYLLFLERLGFSRSQLQFTCLDPRDRSAPLARWKKTLGLTWRDTIHRRTPTNKDSQAVAQWLFIAPDLGIEDEYFDDRLFGYRYLMVMLATAMPVLNSGTEEAG